MGHRLRTRLGAWLSGRDHDRSNHRTDSGPVSYLTLPRGTPVCDRFGAEVGVVDRVLTTDQPFFDGLIVDTPAGDRFVDAPEVRRLTTDLVHLAITVDDVHNPGGRRSHGEIEARIGRTEAPEGDRREAIDGLKRCYVQDQLSAQDLADRVEQAYEANTLDALEALLPGAEADPADP